jgi:hypothetical protein
MIWQTLLTFCGMTALDFVWARYTLTTAEKQPWWAGGYASVLIILSGVVTLTYVNDPWMLIPAAGGAFAGTFLSIKLS